MEINKIPIEILSPVRERMGCEDETDTSMNKIIETMSPMKLMQLWSGWHLGDESWATSIISKYNTLTTLNKKINKKK